MASEPLDYEWFFLTRRMPYDLSKRRFMDNLKNYFEEKAAADPNFPTQLRTAALKAIKAADPDLLRRALAALPFVGRRIDSAQVRQLTSHPCADVAKDARTALFELNHRVN